MPDPTCQLCGKPAVTRWVVRLCQACIDERKVREPKDLTCSALSDTKVT
jgi:hypothetical protein